MPTRYAHVIRCAVVIASSVVCAPRLHGERPPVRVITTADGLPRDQVACVRPDTRGFVWFCTAEGLARFDGHVAVTFGRREGLSPVGVRSFLIGRDGRYWTGSDAGVFEFKPHAKDGAGRFVAVPRADGDRTGAINAIAESRDGTIWCGAGRGLFRMVSTPEGPRLVEVDIGLPRAVEDDFIVRTVVEDDRRTLWVGAGSGLYARRPDGSVTHITTHNGLRSNQIWRLGLDARGRVWAATREGLTLVNRDAVDHDRAGLGTRNASSAVRRVYTSLDGLPASNVRSFHSDGESLWIGTVAGVAEATLTAADELVVRRTLTGFYAWDVITDPHGNVWIATEAGAQRLSRQGFTTYSTADGLPHDRISSLFTNQAGDVCAMMLVGRVEISCFDSGRFARIEIPSLAPIRDPGWGWSQLALQARDGRWWIPSGEGLFEFPAGPASALATMRPIARYDTRTGLLSNSIFRLFEDSRGDLWIATFAEAVNGIARLDRRSRTVHAFGEADGIPRDLPLVHAIAEDTDGTIWIGCEQGLLLRYRAGKWSPVEVRPPGEGSPTVRASFERLSALLVDRKGALWMANSMRGLGRIDRAGADVPRVRWYGSADTLSSDTAWALAEGPSGELFVGTGRGVDRFDPVSERVVHFTSSAGVPRGEIWGALVDRQQRVWFATTGGAARLDLVPDHVPRAPITLVTAVRIAGTSVSTDADGATDISSLTLQPGDRRIEIDFVSPGAHDADGLRYQHRLEGVDTEWTTTDVRSVAIAGAAPGRYRFAVRAILASGLAGEPAHVSFVVVAPLWRRWWFITLALTAVASIAAAFYRVRIRRLVEVERVRARIAADLHDGVGANLSRIAILSDVVQQQAAAAIPSALPAIAAIGDNARAVIDDIGDAVWSIDPRLDSLQEVVVRTRAMATELFDQQNITWTLDAPVDAAHTRLTSEQRRHLFLILKEALTNIVRHANASHVTIRLSATRSRLTLDIEDDGAGLPSTTATPSAGHGLQNLRARASALDGHIDITTNPHGRGTIVRLHTPLR